MSFIVESFVIKNLPPALRTLFDNFVCVLTSYNLIYLATPNNTKRADNTKHADNNKRTSAWQIC